MNPLPDPLRTVTVPELFSPSQLHQARACPLRAVLTAGRNCCHRLPPGPDAELGSLVHELYHRAALGRITRNPTPRTAVEADLARLLADARQRLAASAETARYADLTRCASSVKWGNKREQALTTATDLLATAPDRSTMPTSGRAPDIRYEGLPEAGRWPEVRLESRRLRLSGRADLVEKRPGMARIIDFKSGRVRDRAGTILPALHHQMLWYGLIARELTPDRRVELELRGRVGHEVELGGEALATAEAERQGALAELPAGTVRDASRLARVGPHCVNCRFRPSCPAYLTLAPASWTSGGEEGRLPLDVWGTLQGARPGAGGRLEMTLRDDAGRLVRVTGLEPDSVGSVTPDAGLRLWFFNLQGRVDRVRGRWHHPRNFHEHPPDPTRRRAWALTVFSEPASS